MVLILLDTNAYVALRQGHQGVRAAIADSDGVLMSSIVVGELLFGFRNGSRFDQNIKSLQLFLAEPDVVTLPVTLTTADHYGKISAVLRSKGTPIPTNDIWIAAHASEAEAPLLTLDTHFQMVEGLRLAPAPGKDRQ